jgi:nucleoside 2-deoxyribosyltransferase
MKVYLGGTISADPKHREWRQEIAGWLHSRGHTTYDPMTKHSPENFINDGLHDLAVRDTEFVHRDMMHLPKCDIVICAFFKDDDREYRRQSIGTWAEFGIAFWLRKPIIVYTDDMEVAEHPFVNVYATDVVLSMDELKRALEFQLA